MILTLNIDQVAAARYRAVLTHGDVEVTEPSVHGSVATAISESASAVPEGFAGFIEPRYGGMSAGTMRLGDARRGDVAETAAQTIMQLLGELRALEAR